MTRVILHIGPHKTGTTTLQQGFVALRGVLQAAGILYPAAWQDHLHGHHGLARDLLQGGPETVARLRGVVAEAGAAGKALLRAALGAHVVEHALPDDLTARTAIEVRTLQRYGPAIAGGGTTLFGVRQTGQARHVSGAHWLDPAVPPAFALLGGAIRQRHRDMAAAA